MANHLKELTDQQVLNVLKAAKELELDAAFITLLESELKRRGIDMKQGKDSGYERTDTSHKDSK